MQQFEEFSQEAQEVSMPPAPVVSAPMTNVTTETLIEDYLDQVCAPMVGVVPYAGRQVSFSTWDIAHLSAGSGFTIGRFALTLGASYSFGDHELTQPFDLADPQATVFNPVGTRNVKSQQFKVLAGLNVGLD